jgi:hypothetical protein
MIERNTEGKGHVTIEPSPRQADRKRLIKYALTTVLLLTPITATVLSYNGFCFSQGRFLSDAEMIEPAVRALAENNYMSIDSSEGSVKDFLVRNPDCCAVDRYPDRRSSLDVLTGWNISEIEVNFESNPKFLSRQNYEKYYKRYVSVSACGKFLKYGPGTSTPTLEKPNRLAAP